MGGDDALSENLRQRDEEPSRSWCVTLCPGASSPGISRIMEDGGPPASLHPSPCFPPRITSPSRVLFPLTIALLAARPPEYDFITPPRQVPQILYVCCGLRCREELQGICAPLNCEVTVICSIAIYASSPTCAGQKATYRHDP